MRRLSLCIAFLSLLLAAGCADLHEKAFVVPLTGGGPPLEADCGDDSFSVRLSPDGSRLAVGGASGTIRLYRLPLQASAVERMPDLERGLGAVNWAHGAERFDAVLELVPALRQRFPDPRPELAGWLAHYEYQALFRLGRWQEAWDAMAPVGTPGCVVTPANEAFRHSVAVELAFRLGRFDEIPSHADRCMEIRRDLGDEEGVELCRRMTERCLREAGRADPARGHGKGWVSRIAGWFGRS